jgi:hypothetical protein
MLRIKIRMMKFADWMKVVQLGMTVMLAAKASPPNTRKRKERDNAGIAKRFRLAPEQIMSSPSIEKYLLITRYYAPFRFSSRHNFDSGVL